MIDSNSKSEYSNKQNVNRNVVNRLCTIMAQRCHGSDLLCVTGDQVDDGRVISKLNDDVGAVGGHAVVMNRKHRIGLPSGAPVLRVRVEDVVVPSRTAWGLPVRKLRVQS